MAQRAVGSIQRCRRLFSSARGQERVPRIGEILVRRDLITFKTLTDTLKEQPGTGLKLGELLIRKGALRRAELEAALREQRLYRVLLFVLALGGALPTGGALTLMEGTVTAAAFKPGAIGTVLEGRGIEIVSADGSRRNAQPGSSIAFGDSITTAMAGSARVMLRDRTLLTLEGNATVIADTFIFDRTTTIQRQAKSGIVGTFRVVGSVLSKPLEQLSTIATIGIRG